MSIEDLRNSIARHIRDAIPGHELEDYMRAARAVSSLWRGDEYKAGYQRGKEVGLAESTMGGEVASLRERLARCEAASEIQDGALW
jgi:hypothetical protein